MNRQRASFQKRKSREPNYYEILGVAKDASSEDIKKKYKVLVLKFHPDRENSALAKEAMVSINNAYEELSDQQRRIAYDTSLNKVPEKTPRDTIPKTKRAGLDVVKIDKRISVLLAFAVLISCLVGYQIETLQGARPVSDQFVNTNSHYFTAITHEALVTLPLFIPGFGLVWGVLAGFMTGFFDKAIIMTIPVLPAKVSGLVLPYVVLATILKLAAYQIGMYRSLALVISIRRRRFSKLDSTFMQGEIGSVVLLAALAGFIEHAMVTTT